MSIQQWPTTAQSEAAAVIDFWLYARLYPIVAAGERSDKGNVKKIASMALDA